MTFRIRREIARSKDAPLRTIQGCPLAHDPRMPPCPRSKDANGPRDVKYTEGEVAEAKKRWLFDRLDKAEVRQIGLMPCARARCVVERVLP